MNTQPLLHQARMLASSGQDAAAQHAYLAVLCADPTHEQALVELGALAQAGGHLSAARTVWSQAVRYHPDCAAAYAGLGLLTDDKPAALALFRRALTFDPGNVPAHQGLARLLDKGPQADLHRTLGFAGRAVVPQRYRGQGQGVQLALLVCARGGTIATRPWIDDDVYAVTAVHAGLPGAALPPHAIVVNAIGDADLCADELRAAERLVAGTDAPVINPPSRVLGTGRLAMAARLRGIDGLTVPTMTRQPPSVILQDPDLAFPLLLRVPGYHTGQHVRLVRRRDDLPAAVAGLPNGDLLVIGFHDLRGADGMVRKYRVMFIDGRLYPLHLAISADWKVHYYTAAMADDPAPRAEERRFLDDMQTTFGRRGMAALERIQATLGLDYAGVDCALAADGSLVVFEANATMAIVPPDADPIWDYRRDAILVAQEAARGMLRRRVPAHADIPALSLP
jgi:hypothetical protein